MRRLVPWTAALVVVFGITSPAPVRADGGPQAVYVQLADSLQGTLDQAANALREAFTAEGWTVLATHEATADPRACQYRARVLVLHDPAWAKRVLEHGGTAAFALPLRVVLFEDEAGLHLAAVNLRSVARTMVAESGFDANASSEVAALERVARKAVRGHFASRAYGQVRTRGLIGRTMGIMAGGPFPEKVKVVAELPADDAGALARVSASVSKGLAAGKGRWQLREIYQLDLAAQGVVVIGVSGAAMESKAYAIVGAGGDDARGGYRCPGLAHAAAFPLEVLVQKVEGKIRVSVIDGMYRMKMYFEDAGKMKFAANMGMPGSIEDELRAAVLAGIGPRL